MAPGRGAGLPEGKAGSFAETNGAAAGIGGLPAWGRYRVPKAPKNRYLPKQQIKRHKHESSKGSVPAEPSINSISPAATAARFSISGGSSSVPCFGAAVRDEAEVKSARANSADGFIVGCSPLPQRARIAAASSPRAADRAFGSRVQPHHDGAMRSTNFRTAAAPARRSSRAKYS